jgi:hypothetical protein
MCRKFQTSRASDLKLRTRIERPLAPDACRRENSQSARFQIPPCCWVIVPYPVLVQAALAPESLAGEPCVDGRARHRTHAAEGRIARRPDLDPRGIRRKHRPPDVVGADEAGDATLDHRNRLPSQPDIFPDQRTCALIILRNPAALGIEHRMNGDPGRRNRTDRLPL